MIYLRPGDRVTIIEHGKPKVFIVVIAETIGIKSYYLKPENEK